MDMTNTEAAKRIDNRGMNMGLGHIAPASVNRWHAEALAEDAHREALAIAASIPIDGRPSAGMTNIVHTDERLAKMDADTFGRNAHYAKLLRPLTPELRDLAADEATTGMHITGKRYSTLLAETCAKFSRGDMSTPYIERARMEADEERFRRNLGAK